MKIIQALNYEQLSKLAGEVIATQVNEKTNSLLGLATGSTPTKTYQVLADLYNAGKVDFSQVKSVNLDEYVGIEQNHSQSYFTYMNENFFSHVNIDTANTHLPNGNVDDLQTECKNYETLINRLGGIDLQLLGVGHNGHIGFNEPANAFPEATHVVKLDDRTIKANARFFESEADVPKYAVTMGIGTILKAKKILMLVTGEDKADILYKTLTLEPTPEVQSTALQFHKDVTIIADEKALTKIKELNPELLK